MPQVSCLNVCELKRETFLKPRAGIYSFGNGSSEQRLLHGGRYCNITATLKYFELLHALVQRF